MFWIPLTQIPGYYTPGPLAEKLESRGHARRADIWLELTSVSTYGPTQADKCRVARLDTLAGLFTWPDMTGCRVGRECWLVRRMRAAPHSLKIRKTHYKIYVDNRPTDIFYRVQTSKLAQLVESASQLLRTRRTVTNHVGLRHYRLMTKCIHVHATTAQTPLVRSVVDLLYSL